LTIDLWIGPKDLKNYITLRFLADNNILLLELKDNDYINEYKEKTKDEDVERKGVKDEDIKGLTMDVNKDLGKDESDKEKSQNSNKGFD